MSASPRLASFPSFYLTPLQPPGQMPAPSAYPAPTDRVTGWGHRRGQLPSAGERPIKANASRILSISKTRAGPLVLSLFVVVVVVVVVVVKVVIAGGGEGVVVG
ncbi:hypothetical protein ElyMa_005568300 [Elysia marginata]|uniref:Uncharacterized protein n=1 Tax=Elysia marginata TaxID=1093978 RepID=A0AAV4F0A0_9GAST|nr:hypothetical protein ElyMa_005568300 [Elysia marginata]